MATKFCNMICFLNCRLKCKWKGNFKIYRGLFKLKIFIFSLQEDEPIESLQVPNINEIITTITAYTTSTTSTTTANHIASRFHFPNRRKSSAPIGTRVDPADFQTDVTVATATVNVVPTSDNLLANVTRKINILQRQSTIDEKNFGSKVAQGLFLYGYLLSTKQFVRFYEKGKTKKMKPSHFFTFQTDMEEFLCVLHCMFFPQFEVPLKVLMIAPLLSTPCPMGW